MLRRRSRSVKYEGRRFEVKATRHLASRGLCDATRSVVLTYNFVVSKRGRENEARWIGLLIRLYLERTNSFEKHRAVQMTLSSSSSLVCADRYILYRMSLQSSFVVRHAAISHERRRHLMAILQLQIMKWLWIIKVFYSYFKISRYV